MVLRFSAYQALRRSRSEKKGVLLIVSKNYGPQLL
jgi:hypothetical protein